MPSPTLLVLAAGMGSRYGGLKQLDPMGPGGETILDYSVFDAIRAGFGKVVFVIREDFAEAFREKVGANFADQIEVDYAFQRLDDIPPGFAVPGDRTRPWGTAHAVRAAREQIAEPFAVINADDFYGRDAFARAASFLGDSAVAENAPYCLVGYYLEKTLSDHGGVNRGITESKGPLLRNVEEILAIRRQADGSISGSSVDGAVRPLDPDTIVSMNFWGFTPQFFSQLEDAFASFLAAHAQEPKAECYIPTVVDDLIASGTADCQVLATTSLWIGVTYPDDKPHVVEALARLVEAGEYPASLRR